MSDNHNADMMELIAERIRQRVKELGTNQTEVANALGWTQQRFGNYYNGRRAPDLPSLVRLAGQLETSVDWLLGVNGERVALAQDVLLELLYASGISAERANVIVDALEEAMRLLTVLPGEPSDPVRSQMAAHAAWHSKSATKPS